MPSLSNKKLYILYVLYILRNCSDENHPLMQEEIAHLIEYRYGVTCERKSIGANIRALEDFGFHIEQVKNKGVYLATRELEKSEIEFLADAIFSSRAINRAHSTDLVEKLYNFLSENERKSFKGLYKSDDTVDKGNTQLFYNIEIISEAINKKCKVKFNYSANSLKKEEPRIYTASPYFIMNTQGNYYLVCHFRDEYGVSNLRLDYITDIKIVDEPRRDVKTITGFEHGLEKAKYVQEHIYAFSGNSVTATLKLSDKSVISAIYDWFSKNSRVYEKNGELFAQIHSNENALVYWCMQYCERVEIIDPISTRDRVKALLKDMCKKYGV